MENLMISRPKEKVLMTLSSVILIDFEELIPPASSDPTGLPSSDSIQISEKVLKEIAQKHPLVVISRFFESGSSSIQEKLVRRKLGGISLSFFTSRDLKLDGTDPTYYQAILKSLNRNPEDVVAVGQDYSGYLLPASRAGIKIIWYNPSLAVVPTLPPRQDAELSTIESLPEKIETLTLPDFSTCLAWRDEEGVPPNVAAHSNSVANAAYLLAVWLRQAGELIDPILAHRGGLLHDLDKIKTLKTGNKHGKLSHEFLLAHHQPELAEIALRHNLSAILDPFTALRTWEEKLVFYADKLIEGDRPVLLSERFQALKGRYPGFIPLIDRSAPRVKKLEAKICTRLGKTPEELVANLSGLI
jgi:putative nucleotidyltransferase with HDIG domain